MFEEPLELHFDPDGNHYRCQHCGWIVLQLTSHYVICIGQTEFDEYREDPTCVWKDIDPDTLGSDTCPACRPTGLEMENPQ